MTEISFYLCYQRNHAKPLRKTKYTVTPTGGGLLFQMGKPYLRELSKTSMTILTPQRTCNERQDLKVIFTCALHTEVGVITYRNTTEQLILLSYSLLNFKLLNTLVFCFQGKAVEIPTQGDLSQKEITLSNSRWSRIWVFCRKVHELNYVVKGEMLAHSVPQSISLKPKPFPFKVIR